MGTVPTTKRILICPSSVHTFSETRAAVVGNIRGVEVMGHATVLPQKLNRNGSEEMLILTLQLVVLLN